MLRDFNLIIPANKTVAIVGQSGGGELSPLSHCWHIYKVWWRGAPSGAGGGLPVHAWLSRPTAGIHPHVGSHFGSVQCYYPSQGLVYLQPAVSTPLPVKCCHESQLWIGKVKCRECLVSSMRLPVCSTFYLFLRSCVQETNSGWFSFYPDFIAVSQCSRCEWNRPPVCSFFQVMSGS